MTDSVPGKRRFRVSGKLVLAWSAFLAPVLVYVPASLIVAELIRKYSGVPNQWYNPMTLKWDLYLASYFLFTFVSFAVAGILAAACRDDPDVDASVSAISIWLGIVLVVFAIPWLGMSGVLSLECFMKQ